MRNAATEPMDGLDHVAEPGLRRVLIQYGQCVVEKGQRGGIAETRKQAHAFEGTHQERPPERFHRLRTPCVEPTDRPRQPRDTQDALRAIHGCVEQWQHTLPQPSESVDHTGLFAHVDAIVEAFERGEHVLGYIQTTHGSQEMCGTRRHVGSVGIVRETREPLQVAHHAVGRRRQVRSEPRRVAGRKQARLEDRFDELPTVEQGQMSMAPPLALDARVQGVPRLGRLPPSPPGEPANDLRLVLRSTFVVVGQPRLDEVGVGDELQGKGAPRLGVLPVARAGRSPRGLHQQAIPCVESGLDATACLYQLLGQVELANLHQQRRHEVAHTLRIAWIDRQEIAGRLDRLVDPPHVDQVQRMPSEQAQSGAQAHHVPRGDIWTQVRAGHVDLGAGVSHQRTERHDATRHRPDVDGLLAAHHQLVGREGRGGGQERGRPVLALRTEGPVDEVARALLAGSALRERLLGDVAEAGEERVAQVASGHGTAAFDLERHAPEHVLADQAVVQDHRAGKPLLRT